MKRAAGEVGISLAAVVVEATIYLTGLPILAWTAARIAAFGLADIHL